MLQSDHRRDTPGQEGAALLHLSNICLELLLDEATAAMARRVAEALVAERIAVMRTPAPEPAG